MLQFLNYYNRLIQEMAYGSKANHAISIEEFVQMLEQAAAKGTVSISFTSVTPVILNAKPNEGQEQQATRIAQEFSTFDITGTSCPFIPVVARPKSDGTVRYVKDNDAPNPVMKVTQIIAQIGTDYEKKVTKQRQAEAGPDAQVDAYQAGARKFGTRIDNIIYNGDVPHSLQISPGRSQTFLTLSRNGVVIPLDKDKISPWQKPYASGAARQGVEKGVDIRSYKLSNIAAITLNGEELIIADNAERLAPYIQAVRNSLK